MQNTWYCPRVNKSHKSCSFLGPNISNPISEAMTSGDDGCLEHDTEKQLRRLHAGPS